MHVVLIVVLTALAAQLSGQSAKPRFSHQLHLNQEDVTCVTCHQAATGSDAATDLNMPEEKVCLACHTGDPVAAVDTSFLSGKEPAERTYRFNHEFHLGMGNVAPLLSAAIENGSYLGKAGGMLENLDTENACEACHRGLRETDVAAKANLPQMSDCLVCHSEIRNPFSCEKCHLEGVNLMPANHTRDFVDTHSTGRLGLDKATCLPCHGRNFACMGCH
jgi:predicted CXXCH cytochrome family protein